LSGHLGNETTAAAVQVDLADMLSHLHPFAREQSESESGCLTMTAHLNILSCQKPCGLANGLHADASDI